MKKIFDAIITFFKGILGQDINISVENNEKYNFNKNKKCNIEINEFNNENEKKTLINANNNKGAKINISVGQEDELSYENIWKKHDDVVALENEFSDRLEYSKDILTTKLLPKQLQEDFEIVPVYSGNKIEYETKSTTPDAFEKFPMKISFTVKFNDASEAKKFRENGLNELAKKAEELQQPIEIPNIVNIKEFIGEFEDPVGYANKHGSEGIKLYICPSPLPEAQKYKIEIFNSNSSFILETNLRLKGRYEDKIVLTNVESKDEPFDVMISFTNIERNDENGQLKGKINIKVSLRDRYIDNCEYNKEMIKYKFLIHDTNNHILINNIENGSNIFALEKFGDILHNEEDYRKFDEVISLIEKVAYISKVKGIDIKYDLDNFFKNREEINLIYNAILDKKYTIKQKKFFSYTIPKKEIQGEFCIPNKTFKIFSTLEYISLFGKRIELQPNKLELNDCKIVNVNEDKDNYMIQVESSNIVFIPCK